MTLLRFAVRNLRRSPLRSGLTALAVAVSLVAFLLLRAISAGWTLQVEQTPNNRVVSRHKVGWSQSMPVHYVDQVRNMAGIKQAMGGSWLDLKLAGHEREWFETTAVQARAFIDMHYELEAPSEQKEAFVSDRQGALVSEELAAHFGWKLGDTIVLKELEPPSEWTLNIACIYRSTRHGFAHRSIWVHWEYANEKRTGSDKDKINIISAEIFEPKDGAKLAKAIDIHFDAAQDQTFTQEDQALNASFVGMFGAILQAVDVIGILILGVIALILGNTVTMGVRERVREAGMLRALGFGGGHFLLLVVAEAALLGLSGALLSLGLAFPIIEQGMSRYLSETMDMPPLKVPFDAAAVALVLGAVLGALAAVVPSMKLGRLSVVDALRRID